MFGADAVIADAPAALRERWIMRLDGGLWQARPELRQSIMRGESATFTVNLPLPSTHGVAAFAASGEAVAEPPARQRLVLYIEDVESYIELMHQALVVPFDAWLDKPLRISTMQRVMSQVADPASAAGHAAMVTR